jgi:hypothetical protein
MIIRHADEIPVEERAANARGGKFVFQRILEGPSGRPDNFYLQMARTFKDFDSPRHRHNFDQVRVQLEGCVDFASNGKMTPGTIGYFPEGTRYGPQTSTDDALVLVLQFGGASGNGYMSEDQFQYGVNHLKQEGEFRNGAYFRADSDGKVQTKDGYQAVWEFVNGRPMEYPDERYHTPVMIYPDNFRWSPGSGSPGVASKQLGAFTEAQTRLGLFRLDAGATLEGEENSIYFALKGSGRIDNGARWRDRTTIYLQAGESVRMTAEEPSELFQIGMPKIAARHEMARTESTSASAVNV